MSGDVKRMEIEFAIPVEVTGAQIRALSEIIQEIAKANEPQGSVHWMSGGGDKPMWSDADLVAFPDLQGGRSGKTRGEPTFDPTVLFFTTSCRKRHKGE